MHCKIYLSLLGMALLFPSCHKKKIEGSGENGAFIKQSKPNTDNDLAKISESGELIIGTISGPETYFDYQGRGMGLQYALAENFAQSLGVGVRVELANDSTELVKKLKAGEIDIIAYPLSQQFCTREGIAVAGAVNKKKSTSWAVLSKNEGLIQSLNDWYGEGVEIKAQKLEANWLKNRTVVHRKVHAPFISREKGIISTYDNFFKEAAARTGWDWRLLAAQCYQESGFDPNATSWAGACGLMQIMPNTAIQFGLSQDRIFMPAENIATAAKVIAYLQKQFSNIGNTEERIKFVLASYNGGIGHIRDAQALARKHGGNPQSWNDVSYYVLGLSQAQYYRDAVVKHGYMIGRETANYVTSIFDRWRQYGGTPSQIGSGITPSESASSVEGRRDNPHKRNRFSKEHKILSPEELRQSEQ